MRPARIPDRREAGYHALVTCESVVNESCLGGHGPNLSQRLRAFLFQGPPGVNPR